jgi:hypothetical protein
MESKNKTDVFEREISLDKLSRNGIFIIPLWNLNMMTERVIRNKGNLWGRLSKIIIVKGSYKKIIGELRGFKRM